MGQLHRYIFRQLIWWTSVVAVSLTCVVWLTQSLRFVEMIVNRGLSATTFITFTMLLLPTFLSVIGPIAVFAALMFTYNRMVNDSEVVVLRASGMSPFKIARPALVLAVLTTALGYLNTLYVMPATYRDFKDMQREFRSELSTLFLQEGIFNPVAKGITVFVRERSEDGELYGIIVHDERKPDTPVTMMAEKGAIVSSEEGPRVLMINGNRQEVQTNDGRLSLLYFERYTFDLKNIQEEVAKHWREPRERFLHELFQFDKKPNEIFNYARLRMEGYFRLATPLLYLTYIAIGLAMLLGGDFNRRGQFLRISIAVTTVLLVQVATLGTKSLGEKVPEMAAALFAIPVAISAVFLFLLASPKPKRRRQRKSLEQEPAT
ncbi:MAG: LPS export ABC transporter permease LptF [Pseudomonadota bacterium]|nr:LPS export ABC transporter permease LptF [Pseudomonadota bacterium]